MYYLTNGPTQSRAGPPFLKPNLVNPSGNRKSVESSWSDVNDPQTY
jgi:hypothetical protein